MRWPAQALLILLCAAGCGGEEPVLTGVDPLPTPTLASPAAAESPSPAAAVASADTPYDKPPGVWIDVRYLGGRPWREVRDIVADQLGALSEANELPGDNGREFHFERGTLRVLDDEIILISVPLPTPLRRTEALASLGFSPASSRYITLHREFRLNNEQSFRRLRMMRLNRHSELVTQVDAWKRVPGDDRRPR